MKNENQKKKTIKVIIAIIVGILIITAIVLIIYGCLPEDVTSGGHICDGDGCEIPI